MQRLFAKFLAYKRMRDCLLIRIGLLLSLQISMAADEAVKLFFITNLLY